jgi:hypothetical protein
MSIRQAALGEVAADLSAAILNQLRAEMYANRMLISPRRLREIAQAEVAALDAYLVTGDADAVRRHGRSLALEGLGHRAILGLVAALRGTAWGQADASAHWPEGARQAEDYGSALLEGYMTGREDELKHEQQLTHEAYIRTLTS